MSLDGWKLALFSISAALAGYLFYNLQKAKNMPNGPTRSISLLAAEEQQNLAKHLELLGDTYDLTTQLESLYDSLPPLCRLPLDVDKNDAAHAAGISGNLMCICRRELTLGTLILLRGYRIDSLSHLRKAVEVCAFAAKMHRHPEMSRTWIEAGLSKDAYEKY